MTPFSSFSSVQSVQFTNCSDMLKSNGKVSIRRGRSVLKSPLTKRNTTHQGRGNYFEVGGRANISRGPR